MRIINVTSWNAYLVNNSKIGGKVTPRILTKNFTLKAPLTKTLTFTNDPTSYAQEDGRCKVLNFTGTPGATCTVTFPNKLMWYYVLNNTGDSNDIVCTAGSGAATYTVSAGRDAIIYVDGSDEIYNTLNDLQVTTINGVTADNIATKGLAIAMAVAL